MLSEGLAIPDFSLLSTAGAISRKSLMGSRYVLYLYPKDDTPGCTTESCGFRDLLPKFDASKIKVFGVSADSIKAHEKFISKYQLGFPLIADPERLLIEGLGAWVEKSMYGKKYMGIARSTFVVDGTGKIEKVWDKVSVATHANDVLAYLQGEPESKVARPKSNAAKSTKTKTPLAQSTLLAKSSVLAKTVTKKAVTKTAASKASVKSAKSAKSK